MTLLSMTPAPSISMSTSQTEAARRVRAKIRSGEWTLSANPCLCGTSDRGDIDIARMDRYGLPFGQVLCRCCGIVRSEHVLTPASNNDFYATEYRNLYTGRPTASVDFFKDQYRHGEWFCQTSLSFIPESERDTVLEIGCGAGGILKAISDEGWQQVVGVDLGEQYLQHGRNQGLDLRHGDYRELIADASQRLVVLSHVLEHFIDPVQELRHIAAKLKDGGYLLIEVPGLMSIHKAYTRVQHYFQGAHIYNFSLDHLKALLQAAGYEIVSGDERCTVLARKRFSSTPLPLAQMLDDPAQAKRVLGYLRWLGRLDKIHVSWLGTRLALSALKRSLTSESTRGA